MFLGGDSFLTACHSVYGMLSCIHIELQDMKKEERKLGGEEGRKAGRRNEEGGMEKSGMIERNEE